MKKLSQKEKEKILSRIFWDLSIDSDDFSDMLEAPGGETPSIRQVNLCRRENIYMHENIYRDKIYPYGELKQCPNQGRVY
jgi:hypothetical protein